MGFLQRLLPFLQIFLQRFERDIQSKLLGKPKRQIQKVTLFESASFF
jgi:hypothetical protein